MIQRRPFRRARGPNFSRHPEGPGCVHLHRQSNQHARYFPGATAAQPGISITQATRCPTEPGGTAICSSLLPHGPRPLSDAEGYLLRQSRHQVCPIRTCNRSTASTGISARLPEFWQPDAGATRLLSRRRPRRDLDPVYVDRFRLSQQPALPPTTKITGFCSEELNIGRETHEGVEFQVRSTITSRISGDLSYSNLDRTSNYNFTNAPQRQPGQHQYRHLARPVSAKQSGPPPPTSACRAQYHGDRQRAL